MLDASRILADAITDHIAVIQSLRVQHTALGRIASEMTRTIQAGNKILWCGNGGSAADAQHLAAELVGRFKRDRRALPSIAITTDTSILTAIANDFGFERIFSRQIEALCRPGDLVVGISTSGNSTNVCDALRAGQELGATTVALTGASGGAAAQLADFALCVASDETARIQEAHILCGHILCDLVELSIAQQDAAQRGTPRT